MKLNVSNNAITSFLILIVFGMFALGSLFVVLIGASDYQSIVSKTQQNNQVRASLSYVANKIRQSDESGAIQVVEHDNLQVLTITKEIEGQLYDTYIYFYNGNINEQFVKHNAKLKPSEGTIITPADNFQVSMQNNAVTLQVEYSKIKNPLQMKIQLQAE